VPRAEVERREAILDAEIEELVTARAVRRRRVRRTLGVGVPTLAVVTFVATALGLSFSRPLGEDAELDLWGVDGGRGGYSTSR